MSDVNSFWYWTFLLSIGMFVGSLILIPILLVTMPVDYFTSSTPLRTRLRRMHPIIGTCLIVIKNAVGLLLVVAGLIMLVTPGQGTLAIFVGLMLMDFPGRRSLITRTLGRPKIVRAINRLRARAGRPPINSPPGRLRECSPRT